MEATVQFVRAFIDFMDEYNLSASFRDQQHLLNRQIWIIGVIQTIARKAKIKGVRSKAGTQFLCGYALGANRRSNSRSVEQRVVSIRQRINGGNVHFVTVPPCSDDCERARSNV